MVIVAHPIFVMRSEAGTCGSDTGMAYLLPPGRPRLGQDRTIYALQPEILPVSGAKIKAIGPRSESEAYPCEMVRGWAGGYCCCFEQCDL